MPTNPTPEWVIYKPTGEVLRVITQPDQCHYIFDKGRWHVLSDCLPCLEPLPERYAVAITKENFEQLNSYFNKQFITIIGSCVRWDGTSTTSNTHLPIIPFDRWYFWTLGQGKEYAGNKTNIFNDKTIDTVGKCANCGVEFHIHKEASEPDYRTLYEQVVEQFEKERRAWQFEVEKEETAIDSWRSDNERLKARLEAAVLLITDHIEAHETKVSDRTWTDRAKKFIASLPTT